MASIKIERLQQERDREHKHADIAQEEVEKILAAARTDNRPLTNIEEAMYRARVAIMLRHTYTANILDNLIDEQESK